MFKNKIAAGIFATIFLSSAALAHPNDDRKIQIGDEEHGVLVSVESVEKEKNKSDDDLKFYLPIKMHFYTIEFDKEKSPYKSSGDLFSAFEKNSDIKKLSKEGNLIENQLLTIPLVHTTNPYSIFYEFADNRKVLTSSNIGGGVEVDRYQVSTNTLSISANVLHPDVNKPLVRFVIYENTSNGVSQDNESPATQEKKLLTVVKLNNPYNLLSVSSYTEGMIKKYKLIVVEKILQE